MPNWLFQYRDLLQIMDAFALSTDNVEFQQTWLYTKKMINAHAMAIRSPELPKEEALAIAWSQFEATFDEEDENALLSLAGIIANFVNSVPYGLSTKFYHTIEIGFARARGFSQEEAEEQQRERQLANPDWNFLLDESLYVEEAATENSSSYGTLRLIEGGVESK